MFYGADRESPQETVSPSSAPTQDPIQDYNKYLPILGVGTVEQLSEHQLSAIRWLVLEDQYGFGDEYQWYQRYTMAVLYYATSGSLWASSDWLSGIHICEWSEDIVCDHTQKITGMEVNRRSIEGLLPTEIGRLSSLEVLNVDENFFVGSIPSEITLLSN